jgi:anti-sigma B factor antagonist
MERIRLRTDEVRGVRVVRLEGELDKLGIEKARARLDPLVAAGKLVVDLDRVTFIDSAGLHALFSLSRLAEAPGGGVALAVAETSPTARVIALVHLAEVLPVRATVEEAVSALLQVSSAEDGS